MEIILDCIVIGIYLLLGLFIVFIYEYKKNNDTKQVNLHKIIQRAYTLGYCKGHTDTKYDKDVDAKLSYIQLYEDIDRLEELYK